MLQVESLRQLIAIMTIFCVAAPGLAEAPSLSYFFPAGVQRGRTTLVQCEGKFSWPPQVWASGAEVTAEKESGKLSVSVPDTFASDRIWIRLYNAEGASAAIPLLVGNLSEKLEEEAGDKISDAQVLDGEASTGQVAVIVNGKLQKSGDVDNFAIELEEGQTLVAAVDAHTAFGSPMDAILQVAAPTNVVLAENHDAVGLDPRLTFTASQRGRYIVRMFAFPSQPNSSIRFHGGNNYVYRLTLTTGPYITHAAPMSVPADKSGSVEVFGWNLPPQTRLPVVALSGGEVEPDGVQRTSRSTLGLVFDRSVAGSIRVRRVTHPIVAHIPRTTEKQLLELAIPTTLTGWILQPPQADHFRLRLRKGQQISIAVESQSFHSLLVPVATLNDPSGKTAAESGLAGAASDVVLNYKANQDGDYQLSVRDRFRDGGQQYVYRLTVTEPNLDMSLALDGDAFVLNAAKPLEIPITIARVAGRGKAIKEISIEALGLPPGTKSTAVVSQPSGNTSEKVTLKLETDGTPFSGPIQIRGTASEAHVERFARTPAKFGGCFEQIWLTVKQ